MAGGVNGEAQLGAHPVGTGDQHRAPVTSRDFHQGAKAADAGEHLAALRTAHQGLDAFDEFVAGVDVDARIAIRDAGALCHGLCRAPVGRPGGRGRV